MYIEAPDFSRICRIWVLFFILTNNEWFAGHYCTNGTQSPTQFPCPAGTHNDLVGLRWVEECMNCTGGNYCPGGVVTPTLLCAAGFYCRSGAETAGPMEVWTPVESGESLISVLVPTTCPGP